MVMVNDKQHQNAHSVTFAKPSKTLCIYLFIYLLKLKSQDCVKYYLERKILIKNFMNFQVKKHSPNCYDFILKEHLNILLKLLFIFSVFSIKQMQTIYNQEIKSGFVL